MDLYTMSNSFVKQDLVEGYTSVIWTERYTDSGDFELVVPVNSKSAELLMNVTFLGSDETEEVMQLETRSIENDQLSVTGFTLDDFLDNRPIRIDGASLAQASTLSGTPGLLLDYATISSVGSFQLGMERLGGNYNEFSNLSFPRYLASIGHSEELIADGDETGAWQTNVPITYGSLKDALKQIATTFQIGYGMYLVEADESGYALEFREYVGRNLTSDQTTYPVVQFSSSMDTLKNIKEMHSVAGYKNIAYVFSTSAMAGAVVDPGVAYADASAEEAVDFDRRVILAYNSDIKYDGDDTETNYNTYIKPALAKVAQDLLANNNYIRMVDGEIVPQTGCVYGVDYKLGDIVELLGPDGTKQKARVTEYIRSKDKNAERAYPTVSLVG